MAIAPTLLPPLGSIAISIQRIFAPSTDCTNLAAQIARGESLYAQTYQEVCAPSGGVAGTWLRLGAVVLAVILVVIVGRFVSRPVLRPLRGMTATVRDMGPQNLGQRMKVTDKADEFAVLAREVNDMLSRVAVGFEGQRRFAANASHELRTPLAVQRTLVEVAMVTSQADTEVRRLGAELLLVNERNEQLIEGLLVLAESDRGLSGTVPIQLDELADAVLDAYADLAADRHVALRRSLHPRTVSGDPVLLERLIGNLVHNAIKYNREDGWVEVTVADAAGEPTLLVHNTGQNVPSWMLAILFEPFRRVHADRMNPRDGAGLGLSIVRSITAAHNGTVRAVAGDDGGLRISVDLP